MLPCEAAAVLGEVFRVSALTERQLVVSFMVSDVSMPAAPDTMC